MFRILGIILIGVVLVWACALGAMLAAVLSPDGVGKPVLAWGLISGTVVSMFITTWLAANMIVDNKVPAFGE